jgi:hypothetical protein
MCICDNTHMYTQSRWGEMGKELYGSSLYYSCNFSIVLAFYLNKKLLKNKNVFSKINYL